MRKGSHFFFISIKRKQQSIIGYCLDKLRFLSKQKFLLLIDFVFYEGKEPRNRSDYVILKIETVTRPSNVKSCANKIPTVVGF